jgi:hypothetical protein
MASSGEDREAAGSILKELIFNQYQGIVLAGVAAASLISLNPLPLLAWLGSELVLLPLLDSGPLRRLVRRRRNAASRGQAEARRARLIASFNPAYAKRYRDMENLCRLIETNYQGLHGTSQAYLSEQRNKLDMILDGCLSRMLALQRYDRMLASRDHVRIEEEIKRLEAEARQPGLPDRARLAFQKNVELKRKLIAADSEAKGTVKALSTELDSMASLLEVLHQNSISMRDPQTISHELDSIVRQSEDSGKMVREMEALLGSAVSDWSESEIAPISSPGVKDANNKPGPPRQRVN